MVQAAAQPATFSLRKSVLFKGKASVTDGAFNFSFIVPKDINYEYGIGRISYYVENGQTDAAGYDENFYVGGIDTTGLNDDDAPKIKVFMNDEKFIFGGLTNNSPLLLAKISDNSGINTTGNGIGHDITAIIDEEGQNPIMLNEYYESAVNNYQEGQVRYPLSEISEGLHTLTVKAWDVNNNSGKGYTEFVVASSAELALDHVLNYPNPFTDHTAFWFEHNHPNEPLTVTVQIFTVSGKLLKTIRQEVASPARVWITLFGTVATSLATASAAGRMCTN